MEYKKTIPITLLVLALGFILLFSDNGFLQSAYALTITDVDITDTSSLISETSTHIVTLSNTNREASFINKNTFAEITVDFNAQYPAGNTLNSLSCASNGNCFMKAVGPESGNGTIVRFTTAGITANYDANTDTVGGSANALTGNSMTAVFGTTVFFGRVCSAVDTDLAIYSVDGNNMVGAPSQRTLCDGSLSTASQGVLAGLSITGTNGVPYLGVMINGAGGTADIYRSVNLLTLPPATSISCSLTITGNSFGVSQHMSSFSNNFYIIDKSATGDSTRIREIDPTDCSTSVTSAITIIVDSATTGISVDSFNDVIYLSATNDDANFYVHAFNFTSNVISNTVITTYNVGALTTGVKYSSNLNNIYAGATNYLRIFNLGAGEGGANEEFCSNPANANVLTCRLESEGNTGLSGTSQLLNQSATNILCQVGFLECTQDEEGNFIPDNPDVQTNGVGYILVAIAMAIFVGLLWVGSRGSMTEIPTFVWFIGTIAIVATFTAIEYIDPTFLVITVITVVAFAVAKAKGIFSGSELFKGESF